MAITVINQPGAIVFSKNFVTWKLETDKFITYPGNLAWRIFTFTGDPNSGETISLAWSDADIIMEFVNTPDDSGYQLPLHTVGSLGAYIGVLAALLQLNYFINRDFIVSAVGNTLLFTARINGSLYNLIASDTVVNGSWGAQTYGADKLYNPNFFIAVDTFVENVFNSGIYTRLEPRFFKPDENQQVEFSVDEQLHAFLEREINAPDYMQTVVAQCNNINKRWYITYTEFYGEPAVFHKVITSDVKKVFKGGVNHEYFTTFNNLWFTIFPLTPFLITKRVKRNATKQQQEYLYYVNAIGNAPHRLMVRVDYSNNTNTTINAMNVNLQSECTHLLPSGFNQLNLEALNPTLRALRWYVWLEATTSILVSEVLVYEIVKPSHIERYFIYENSLGAWETLRTEGQKEHSVEIKKNEFEKLLPFNYKAEEGNIISRTENYQDMQEVYTGHYFTKEEAQDLIDLLKAENIFELVDTTQPLQPTSGKKVPVYIEPDSFVIDRDDNYQYGVKFKYRPAYKERNYGWR